MIVGIGKALDRTDAVELRLVWMSKGFVVDGSDWFELLVALRLCEGLDWPDDEDIDTCEIFFRRVCENKWDAI